MKNHSPARNIPSPIDPATHRPCTRYIIQLDDPTTLQRRTKCNHGLSSNSPSVCAPQENPSHRQRPSTGGRRTKFWTSMAQLPFGSWDFGHHSDTKRPQTSPSTPSSWMSFSDHNRVGSLDERPSTVAFSARPSQQQQTSKLERYWQWPGKRFSRFMMTSPSPPVQTTTVSPSKSSFRSSPSTPSSTLPTPTSPCTQPPTLQKKAVSQTSPVSLLFQDSPTPDSCNRSTPTLQPPDLSMEDLGKVNARYAPLPSTLRVWEDPSRRPQVVSLSKSAPEASKPAPRLPSSIPPLSTSALSTAVLPTPAITTHSPPSHSHARLVNRRGMPIALPLSPVESLQDGGEFFSREEGGGVIYLTVEEDGLDEESGEASLCLVEVP